MRRGHGRVGGNGCHAVMTTHEGAAPNNDTAATCFHTGKGTEENKRGRYIYTNWYIYIYIYIYKERDRERDRETETERQRQSVRVCVRVCVVV